MGGGGGVGRESPFAREVRGDKVKKHKLPVLLKLFQSLLTSPEFVQNLKASSSLIMGCPLAKETALSCIQIRYKSRNASVNKAKNNPNEHIEK